MKTFAPENTQLTHTKTMDAGGALINATLGPACASLATSLASYLQAILAIVAVFSTLFFGQNVRASAAHLESREALRSQLSISAQNSSTGVSPKQGAMSPNPTAPN